MQDVKLMLSEILSYADWTQEEMANRLGVSFSTLNAWLNDKATPHRSSHDKIVNLYEQIVGYQHADPDKLAQIKTQALAGHFHVGRLLNHQELLDQLTLHLTYHTNGIEGSTLTLQDVKSVLEDDKVLANKTAREQLEARNHRAALYFVLDEVASRGHLIWNEELIQQIHLRLMNSLITNAGNWRQHGVRINGSLVNLAAWEKVPMLMRDLMIDLNDPGEDFIEWLARTHSRFETIHPFSDGNGRTGRLILLAQALIAGLWPPLIAKQRKKAYYWYLEMAQLDHNYQPLALLLGESIIATKQLLGGAKTLWNFFHL